MIDRFARLAIACAASTMLAVPAIAQPSGDLPAYKQPATDTTVTYDEAIGCQATYVVLGTQYDEGTEEQDYYRSLYNAWYEFNSDVYPLDFAQHHDTDMNAEADRLFAAWDALEGEPLQAAVDSELNRCEALEDSELLFL